MIVQRERERERERGVETEREVGVETEREVGNGSSSLPLLSLNHVSFVCKSVSKSVRFYEDVLGFMVIKRPSSFKFEGAWLFNYGIGIHLLECNSPNSSIPEKKDVINPKDNHISFQCSDMRLVMKKLEEMGIDYVTAVVEEGGVKVDQLFFHDPDGYMIEICNCENLPVLPLSACPLKKLGNYTEELSPLYGKQVSNVRCVAGVESSLMENLLADMIYISF